MRLYKIRVQKRHRDGIRHDLYVVATDPSHAFTLALHHLNMRHAPIGAKEPTDTPYQPANTRVASLEELAIHELFGHLVLPFDLAEAVNKSEEIPV